MAEALDVLRKSSLFGGCDEAQLENLAGIANERSFEQGATIVHEGDTTSAGMWLILEGEVEVSTGSTVLATLGSGDHFGEIALVEPSGSPRSADVYAKTPVQALQITRWDLHGLIGAHPDIALTMLASVGDRLRNTNEALSE